MQIQNRGLIIKQLPGLYSAIGKATADKITAKLVGKTHACHSLAFARIINSNNNHAVMQRISLCYFEYLCAFR